MADISSWTGARGLQPKSVLLMKLDEFKFRELRLLLGRLFDFFNVLDLVMLVLTLFCILLLPVMLLSLGCLESLLPPPFVVSA